MQAVQRNPLEGAIVGICSIVLWVTTVVIFVILTANTILRYTGGTGLPWANELPELLFPWLVMAGVVLAAEKGSHIATVFMMEALPPRWQRIVAVAGWLVVAALYATLSKATYGMLEIVQDEKSPILHVPGSVTYSCVLAGMAMLALLALQSAWQVWRAQPATASHAADAVRIPHW
ncbi:MAG TPA: TRAP transporter small permease [Burkholderiaceae bacterium]|nr:TRAP transporter small permease [Burkholderiaceae bacterium]